MKWNKMKWFGFDGPNAIAHMQSVTIWYSSPYLHMENVDTTNSLAPWYQYTCHLFGSE